MRVYLLAPVSKTNELQGTLEEVEETLNASGHQLVNQISEAKNLRFDSDPNDIIKKYDGIRSLINSADLVIAELTYPSSGIGFIISERLRDNKNVFVLVNKDVVNTLLPIQATKSKKLKVIPYRPGELNVPLKEALKGISTKTRFVFNMHKSDEVFLEWLANNEKSNKSKLLRKTIKSKMENDDNYKKTIE